MLLAALIIFALAVSVTGMLGLGAAMVYKGFLRGTLIDGHLHCGRCGYDMVGHQNRPVRCPECGSDLRVPGMVCVGARRPHKRRIGLGLALIALNVGGLVGCWKLGEVQPTSSSLAAAPDLGPGCRTVAFITTTDRLADLDSGPDEQTVPELSSTDSNDAARRSARVELIFADTTIQLPPRHRQLVQPVTLVMPGFDQGVWPSLPGLRVTVMHVIPPASPNDERFLEPGVLKSWLVFPELGTTLTLLPDTDP
ncbi:MAG: hypothetical protein V3T53_01190 [Phycisphaerales bacterium]